jgi:hypothetical protein
MIIPSTKIHFQKRNIDMTKATEKSFQDEIAELNARLKELESKVSPPPPPPVPEKKKPFPSTCRCAHFVVTFSDGVQNMWTRVPVYSRDQAIVEARERAKLRGYPVVFIPWDREVTEANVGFKNAVLIIEEFSASGSQGCYTNVIRKWDFEGAMPTAQMIWQPIKV